MTSLPLLRLIAIAVTVLPLSACKDGDDAFSPRAAAIASALSQAGVLSGKASGYAAFALSQIDETGRLNLATQVGGTTAEFEAAGILFLYDTRVSVTDLNEGWFNGVVAWRGLDETAGTAQEVLQVGAEGSGPAAMLTGEAEVGAFADDRGGLALYHRTGPVFYVGNGGTYTVTAAEFGENEECRTSPEGGAPPFTCRVATGTMTGTFSYTAQLVDGTGEPTFTQPGVSFTIPAVRVSLSN